MSLFIKNDETARLVFRFAKLHGVSKQDAVRIAVQAELDRAAGVVPLRDRFAALRMAHPLPPASGAVADKLAGSATRHGHGNRPVSAFAAQGCAGPRWH